MFADDVAVVEAAIDDLAAGDVEGVPGADLDDGLVRLQAVKAKLAAVEARATASYEASGDWATDGPRSATAALAHRCRLRRHAGSTADGRVRAHGDHPGPGVSEGLQGITP